MGRIESKMGPYIERAVSAIIALAPDAWNHYVVENNDPSGYERWINAQCNKLELLTNIASLSVDTRNRLSALKDGVPKN